MQGGTTPWGKETLPNPEGSGLNEEISFSKMATSQVSQTFVKVKLIAMQLGSPPSLTIEPPPVLGGILLQKPLFG